MNNKNQPGPQIRGSRNLVQSVYTHDAGTNSVDAGSTLYVIGQTTNGPTYNVVQYVHSTRGGHDTGNELSNFSGGTTPPHHNQWKNSIFDGGWGLGWQTINSTTSHPVAHHGLFEGNVVYGAGRLITPYKPGVQVTSDNTTDRGGTEKVRRR
jgi:hypothetical protein